MKILKSFQYKSKIIEGIYNIYIAKSGDYYYTDRYYIAFDGDGFYGGLTFGNDIKCFYTLLDAESYIKANYQIV